VRESYHRQAAQDGWLRLDGERPREMVAGDVRNAIERRLSITNH